MAVEQLIFLTISVFVVAFLYSSVGQAGASGYIAVMSLFSLAPFTIKPTALVLNTLVAIITAWQFYRAGHFSWPLFWPFAILATPFAFVGGYMYLPNRIFNVVVGVILLLSVWGCLSKYSEDDVRTKPSRWVSIPVGAGLGLLSGLTGTGGGIFLTPLLLFMHWATVKEAAAVSALFILVNSVFGLLGNLSSTQHLPNFVGLLALAVVIGGTAGSYFGSQRLPLVVIRRLLAFVLLVGGIKLLFTR